MKICTIIYAYPPDVCGGADVYAHRISKELSKKGHDVVVITTKPYRGLRSLKPSFEELNGIKIYRFYPMNIFSLVNLDKKPMYLKIIWQFFDLWNIHAYYIVKSVLKKEKPDVVHIHTPIWFSLSVFDAVKKLNIPSVFTLHDYLLLCRRTILLHPSGKICNKPKLICKIYQHLSKAIVNSKPDVVTSPSQFVLDMHINNQYFVKSNHVKLPLGIDIATKKRIEKEYNTIDILYVGNLVKHKGVQILIKAFRDIKESNLRLHIAGKGPYADELKRLAKNDERIIFYGFVTESKLFELYELANITVVPSIWYDNSPVVIYESFKSGTPVIGSDIGGIPELIKDGYNGYLFEAGNINELKSIINKLPHSKENLKLMHRNVLESIKKYGMNKHIESLENIYNVAIKK